MPTPKDKPRPWLIAAWPGMGSVAIIAAGFLVRQLRMKDAGQLPAKDHFDIEQVHVKRGLITTPRIPRGVFFHWTNPSGGRDFIVFLGESQPDSGSYAYAHSLLDAAMSIGVERAVTFAAIASGLHPAQHTKVWGVATDQAMIRELERTEVPLMEEGEIGGLNGVLLGAAAERGMDGLCLLAEIPFFAAGVPNPKASRAALSVFSVLSGVEVSLDELSLQAEAMDKALIEAMERLKQRRDEEALRGEEGDSDSDDIILEPPQSTPPPKVEEAPLDFTTRKRIEHLFHEARKDQSRALKLKEELDRLGMFKKYENRFLDLFRRAG